MTLSDKPTAHLMIQAKTDSEWDKCDYAIVQITENWQQEMQKRLDAVAHIAVNTKDFSSLDYLEKVYFYEDDNQIDSMGLLGEQNWSFVIPSKKDLQFLSTPENKTTGWMLEIEKNGWASYSTHRLYNSESWTVDFSIEEVLKLFNE